MKKNILFTLFAIVLFPSINFGCRCALPPSFCEGLTSINGDFMPDMILRGKIIGEAPSSKEVKIIQVLFGKTSESKITITDFWHCQPFFHQLKNGQEYILALREDFGETELITCSIILIIENEIVKGQIAPGIESIPYNELGSLKDCGDLFRNSVSIFPNPTGGDLKIKNLSSESSLEKLQIEIFDVLGRKIAAFENADAILPEEIWYVNIEKLAPGVYYFKLSGINREGFFKIVKQ